jgi:hypothetical protein
MLKRLRAGLAMLAVIGTSLVVTGTPARADTFCATTVVGNVSSAGPYTILVPGNPDITVQVNAYFSAITHDYCGPMWTYVAFHHNGNTQTAKITASLFWGASPSDVWFNTSVSRTESATGANMFFDSPQKLPIPACGLGMAHITLGSYSSSFQTGPYGVCPP